MNKFVSSLLGLSAVVASASPVSFQDVTSLTNTRTAQQNRWLAHLVSVPAGSEHYKVAMGKKSQSVRNVEYVVGVSTSETMYILDRRHAMKSGEAAQINRDMMGDRVFSNGTSNVLAASYKLTKPDTLVSGSIAKTAGKTKLLMAKAWSFNKTASKQGSKISNGLNTGVENTSRARTRIAKGQMKQARAVARAMAKVADAVRREEIDVAANPARRANVTAYAAHESPMASAFAAVLRPTLKKLEEKKAKEGKTAKNGLKDAIANLSKPSRRKTIKLGRGDHKWAAFKLPRSTYSAKQRRCLAAGVYFEARSEPLKGQQAVAQVILNRVKNPTYPNTVCGVVYQNKWRRNACQFSFACDGIRDRINSKGHWRKAYNVASDAIEGRIWLTSVGSSSHYHADYVWPRWRRKMRRMTKIGRHIFYRTYGGGWS